MIEIKKISSQGMDLQTAAAMFREYGKELNEDINFQDFEKELSNPLTKYGPPTGALLIAFYDTVPSGCIALQALEGDGICEMKRLYVRPAQRHHSIGKILCDAIINEAKNLNYKTMVLDTLEKLEPAISLYKRLGFIETEAYYNNPLKAVIYMKKDLR